MKTYMIFGRLLGICSVVFGLYILIFEIFYATFVSAFALAVVAVLVFVGISMVMEDGS